MNKQEVLYAHTYTVGRAGIRISGVWDSLDDYGNYILQAGGQIP